MEKGALWIKKVYEHSIRLNVQATYNVVEYEADIHELKIVKSLGVERVITLMDSQLIARRSIGEFMAKEILITKYSKSLETIASLFEHVKIEQIPGSLNMPADVWARLGWGPMRDSDRVYTKPISQRHPAYFKPRRLVNTDTTILEESGLVYGQK